MVSDEAELDENYAPNLINLVIDGLTDYDSEDEGAEFGVPGRIRNVKGTKKSN